MTKGNERPIRTLHIVHRLDTRLGGAVHATLGVCKFLARAGQPVEVAGTIGPRDELSYLDTDYSEFRTHRFERSFPKRYANSDEFCKWFPGVLPNYDLVELHTIFSAIIFRAAQICRKAGVPYLVRPHGSLDPFDLKKHARLKALIGPRLVRPLLAGAAGAVLTAPLEAERLETYGAVIPRLVAPLPVILTDGAGDGLAFRRRHGIPENALVVLFMSRIDYKKGLDFLIPSIARLRRKHPLLRFVIAGSGDSQFLQRVRGWVSSEGIEDITKEVGFISGLDKQNALDSADVFALPSMNENFGIVLIEAMHCGLPLLISDEVYIHKDIQGAGAGLVCRPEIGSVVAKLDELLGDGALRRRMGLAGRQLVAERYRPQAATDLLVATYREVLAKVRSGPLRD